MDDGLKQRIIGAFVLVAVGVVLLPLIFDRERIEPVNRKTQIPLAPHIETVDIQAPIEKPVEERAAPPDTMFLPDKDKDVATVGDEPVLDTKGVPNSWVIQVASYRFEGHAEKMRDKLIADGYSAYIRDVKTERGKLRRLFIGPNLDKSKLEKIQQSIEKKYSLSTILLKFEP
ncbi:DedD protein [Alteromonadaceae bacterium 2753L.S.0a.02]|nr:DedD protein [Alteromonadaceae bacterium 2753L.S.0a.02]